MGRHSIVRMRVVIKVMDLNKIGLVRKKGKGDDTGCNEVEDHNLG